MAFVYEEVGKENEALWNEIGWRDWAERPKGFYEKKQWCADKERGVYMLPIGSFRDETPDYYDLAYKKVIVRIERGFDPRDIGIKGYVFVRVDRVYIPISIWEYRDDICGCIKESFVAYEREYNSNMKVDVEFECEPECVEADYNGR
ncbi:MAG: hypothetical protein K6C99_01660 [Lachnospiraceae bacterium]|nr:hypothetical protein [Lachnospiraceae bacterium]